MVNQFSILFVVMRLSVTSVYVCDRQAAKVQDTLAFLYK